MTILNKGLELLRRFKTFKNVKECELDFYFPDKSRFVLDEVFRDKQYLEFLEDIEKNLRTREKDKSLTIVDLGANFGVFPLILEEKLGGLEMSYKLFEPFPENLNYLQKNLSENKISHTIHSKAVSDRKGETTLFHTESWTGPTINEEEAIAQKPNSESIKVKKINLDSYNWESVDLVKLDIEGSEEKALKGMQQTLKKHKPLVISSFEHRSNDLERIKELIDVDGCYEFKISEQTEFLIGLPS